MDRQTAFTTVVGIIKPFVRNEEALQKVSESSKIIQDLQVNSARLVDIAIAFEDAFKVTIEDADAEKINTIGDAVTMLLEKQKEEQGSKT